MLENKKYETLSLEELNEAEKLVLEIVMREGSLRFQEQVVDYLTRLKANTKDKKVAEGIQKSIDLVYRHEVKID
jgi:hypothetical protein